MRGQMQCKRHRMLQRLQAHIYIEVLIALPTPLKERICS